MNTATAESKKWGIPLLSGLRGRIIVLAAVFVAVLAVSVPAKALIIADYYGTMKAWDNGCYTYVYGEARTWQYSSPVEDETVSINNDQYYYCATNVAAKAFIQENYESEVESAWVIDGDYAYQTISFYHPNDVARWGKARSQAQINGTWTAYFGNIYLSWW